MVHRDNLVLSVAGRQIQGVVIADGFSWLLPSVLG